MNTKLNNTCPQCGTRLPSDAPSGLCPNCLMSMNLATNTKISGESAVSAKKRHLNAPSVEEIAVFFPQLEILECLGQGGMGVVYKARQKELDRVVALKILPREIGCTAGFADRFTREARALAKLNHPGIVTLYEFGHVKSGGDDMPLYFFLMEYVDGVNLRLLMHGERISAREALGIVPQICEALQFAHDHGIVHRDIKPENILIDRRGSVKVADFGLAKITECGDVLQESQGKGDGREREPNLTEAGKVMGTPRYMSPEQIEAPGEVDHRADIYALGVVFYQMLTGEMPGTPIEPPSRKVKIDVRLDEIVLRALEKEPARRYQMAGEFRTVVETMAEEESLRGSGTVREVVAVGGWMHRKEVITLLGVALVATLVALISYAVLHTLGKRDINPSANPAERVNVIQHKQVAEIPLNKAQNMVPTVDFNGYFEDSVDGGKALEELWKDKNKDMLDEDEIVDTVRSGLRHYNGSGNILRWIGNRFIWGKTPQNAKMVELMYHASGSPDRSLYGDAVYFGLSVTREKTPEILCALAAVAMKTEDYRNVTGRILWGCKGCRDKLIACLDPYLNSEDAAVRQKARDVKEYFADSKSFMAKRSKMEKDSIRREYGDELEEFKKQMLNGDLRARLDVLKQLRSKNITSIIDSSFLNAFEACLKDPNPEVRAEAAKMVGSRFVWRGGVQNKDAIAMLVELLDDPERSVRYSAVYYGLSTVLKPDKELTANMLATILDDREVNYYGRVIWGVTRNKEACVEVLQEWMNQSGQEKQRALKAYEIYEDVISQSLPEEFALRFAGQKSDAYEGLVSICFSVEPLDKEALKMKFINRLTSSGLLMKVSDFYIIQTPMAAGMFVCDNLADRNAVRDTLTKDGLFQVFGYMRGKIGPVGSGWLESLDKFRARRKFDRVELTTAALCSPDMVADSSYLGVWEGSRGGKSLRIELMTNGVVLMSMNDQCKEGRWAFEGDGIRMSASEHSVLKGVRDGETLVVSNGSSRNIFYRLATTDTTVFMGEWLVLDGKRTRMRLEKNGEVIMYDGEKSVKAHWELDGEILILVTKEGVFQADINQNGRLILRSKGKIVLKLGREGTLNPGFDS